MSGGASRLTSVGAASSKWTSAPTVAGRAGQDPRGTDPSAPAAGRAHCQRRRAQSARPRRRLPALHRSLPRPRGARGQRRRHAHDGARRRHVPSAQPHPRRHQRRCQWDAADPRRPPLRPPLCRLHPARRHRSPPLHRPPARPPHLPAARPLPLLSPRGSCASPLRLRSAGAGPGRRGLGRTGYVQPRGDTRGPGSGGDAAERLSIPSGPGAGAARPAATNPSASRGGPAVRARRSLAAGHCPAASSAGGSRAASSCGSGA